MIQAFWFLWGACIGSFLNVCIYRMPREESLVRPRSRCPGCRHPIAWHDNVPVVSYLLLRGRCRHCRSRIHWRYPLVELLTAAATVGTLAHFGMGLRGVVALAFVYALIVVSFIDLEFQIIPDEISLGGLALGLILSAVWPALHGTASHWVSLRHSVIGALVGGGILYLTGIAFGFVLLGLRHLGVQLRHHPFWRKHLAPYRHIKDSMGGGDVKLLAMAGSLLGWKLVVLTFFLAPFLALVPGLFVLLTKRSHVIPYGPFLSLALLVSLFVGLELLQRSGIENIVQFLWSCHGWS